MKPNEFTETGIEVSMMLDYFAGMLVGFKTHDGLMANPDNLASLKFW